MYKYNFGLKNRTLKYVAAAVGNVEKVFEGAYLLIVVNETVEIMADTDTVAAAGTGTPLAVGTQIGIRVEKAQNWSFRSTGGTGAVWLVRVE